MIRQKQSERQYARLLALVFCQFTSALDELNAPSGATVEQNRPSSFSGVKSCVELKGLLHARQADAGWVGGKEGTSEFGGRHH